MRPSDYGVLILCTLLLSWHRTSDARDTYNRKIKTGPVEVSWTLEENNLAMAVSAATKGYLALGFSESGTMYPSNVVVGSASDESSSISEWALNGKNAAQIAPLVPSIITATSAEELNGVTIVRFERPLIQDGRSIDPNKDVTMIWALHDTSDTLRMHSSKGSFSVNLKNGTLKELTPPEISAHAILMWLAFGVLMPVAILAARFKYRLSGWFNIHSGSMMLSVILILASLGVIFSFKLSKEASHASGFHEIFGFVIIAGTIIQATGGIVRPNHESRRRKSWFLQHSWTGRLIYFSGVLNLVFGIFYFNSDIDTGNDPFTWLLAVIITCVGLFVVALIVGYFTKSNQKKNMPDPISLDTLQA